MILNSHFVLNSVFAISVWVRMFELWDKTASKYTTIYREFVTQFLIMQPTRLDKFSACSCSFHFFRQNPSNYEFNTHHRHYSTRQLVCIGRRVLILTGKENYSYSRKRELPNWEDSLKLHKKRSAKELLIIGIDYQRAQHLQLPLPVSKIGQILV